MLVEQDFTDRDFTLYKISEESNTNPIGDRTDYLALGTFYKSECVVKLSYYSNGFITLKAYFNKPLQYAETFFSGEAQFTSDLDEILDKFKFEISEIDLTKLTTDYE